MCTSPDHFDPNLKFIADVGKDDDKYTQRDLKRDDVLCNALNSPK